MEQTASGMRIGARAVLRYLREQSADGGTWVSDDQGRSTGEPKLVLFAVRLPMSFAEAVMILHQSLRDCIAQGYIREPTARDWELLDQEGPGL
jgi:hypothetical protein